MVQKGPLQAGWRDPHVKEALDLCLACKGCKGDCPVNVDVATYKAEFLSHYYEGRPKPVAAYAFGLIDVWARLASIAPGLVNLATQLPVLSSIAKALVGVPQRRRIPAFAAKTFQSWFRAREARNEHGERVVLWADTFNNHFTPEVAEAAVRVLEDAGFRVDVPRGHLCCGRPLYDYGMLDRAKAYLERVMGALREDIAARTPIIALEPSCCSVFRDELKGLFPDRGDARLLAEQVVTLSEFLASGRVRASGWKPPAVQAKAIVQGHCHHKAIMKFEPEARVLREAGLDADVLASGCCGMAGAFGYEKDKIEVSLAAGERVLLPRVREAPESTWVLADGFSCRSQIEQETDRGGLHLAQVLDLAKDAAPGEAYPERRAQLARRRAQRGSMLRAGMGLLGFLALVVLAIFAFARG
jgi:Fe-S oxidoreductase